MSTSSGYDAVPLLLFLELISYAERQPSWKYGPGEEVRADGARPRVPFFETLALVNVRHAECKSYGL